MSEMSSGLRPKLLTAHRRRWVFCFLPPSRRRSAKTPTDVSLLVSSEMGGASKPCLPVTLEGPLEWFSIKEGSSQAQDQDELPGAVLEA